MGTTNKPEQAVDKILQRVFAVTLSPGNATAAANPPVVYLNELATELRKEISEADSGPMLMRLEFIEQLLVARLSEWDATYPLSPVQYLLGCYTRASDEIRNCSAYKDKDLAASISNAMVNAKQLLVSYTGFMLIMDMFPQPEAAQARGSLQLLDTMDGIGAPMPPNFLGEFAERFKDEGLDGVLAPIVKELSNRVLPVSILGNFSSPLTHLITLVNIKPMAEAIVKLPNFLQVGRGPNAGGRTLQMLTVLGPFFSVSALPDELLLSRPNVREECFSNVESRRPGDIQHSFQGIRISSKQLHEQLHEVVMKLLKNKDTRDSMIQWLGNALNSNMERAKMQVNQMLASTDGFSVNLCAVLMRLCEPFVEPASGKAWGKVDANYVNDPAARLDFKKDSRLAATEGEVEEWVAQRQASANGASSSTNYHFICECFFMTAEGLRLGVCKIIQNQMELGNRLHHMQRQLQEIEAQAQRFQGTPQEALVNTQLQRGRNEVKITKENQYCYEAVLQDEVLLRSVLSFYRLVSAWMLRVVSPNTSGRNKPKLPLPEPPPMDFRTLPEWLIEDVADVLQYIGRSSPHLFEGTHMEEFMIFLVAFICSPSYVKNPYLRMKMVKVLHVWMPQENDENRNMAWRMRRQAAAANLEQLFEGDPFVLQYLVPGLLRLYADIEFIDRAGQFYERFHMRLIISELLEHLWHIPQHHAAWKQVATQDAGRGVYLNFCNMLVNDSIYLLDESLKKLPELRDTELLMSDANQWNSLAPNERQERESAMRSNAGTVKAWLYYASVYIKMLQYSTTDFTSSFLLPEMVDRIAAMLNYFLLYLTGPERKKLKVKDPEKYNWHPKQLLTQIAQIYLHLARDDKEGCFAVAIAKDGRSYREQMFSECAQVLRKNGLLPESDIHALELLAEKVKDAATERAAEDEIVADAPDEFLDPIQYTLMRDPVIMPTSGTTVDRTTITRHLLSDLRDPINRKPLTVEMLIPNHELKSRIDAWMKEQRENAMRQ